MDDAEERGEVDAAVEEGPAFSEAPDPAPGGRERQRQEDDPGREPDGDERPIRDVLPDEPPFEDLIQSQVDPEVDGRPEEGEEPERATELDELVQSRDAPE